jgi:hypothetical protein
MDYYLQPPHPDHGMIDITMPHPPTEPLPPWVRVRVRPDLDPELDMTEIDGIPVTTVERTIVDLAEDMFVIDVVEVIDIAAQKGLIDFDKLDDTIRRVQHPRASRVAQAALDRWRRGDDLDTILD